MVQLPAVYEDDAQPQARRVAFAEELDRLAQWVQANASADLVDGFVQQPFHLAYQEADNRDLLAKYGTLCCTVMERWRAKQRFVAPDKPKSQRIKLGIASAHIHAHSVWEAIVKGWLSKLDPERVEFHLFHLGSQQDAETELARGRAAYFEPGPRNLREWVDAIAGQRLDALAFPEIAMHSLTAQLASLRLAPVQFASWGHPQTTGIPTVDYYVSAEGFEPPDAQRNYTEQLVRLPNLGCFYQPHPVTAAIPDLAALGISQSGPLLLCCGTPFKYLPSYDRTLTAIAHALGSCQFVFFADRALPSFMKLRHRLQLGFERAGLDFERHVVFVPWQPRPQFYGLLQRADAFLDTVGFSGFNTAMQAVECGLPIVARPGSFMRGRFASAILKRMQLEECVAASESGYVELAVKLVRDAGYRARIRAHIEASRAILYEDAAPMSALQEFLATACTRSSS
jgi:predicted O-linked N-acetylglucosamine transferase (SPINDLY family)